MKVIYSVFGKIVYPTLQVPMNRDEFYKDLVRTGWDVRVLEYQAAGEGIAVELNVTREEKPERDFVTAILDGLDPELKIDLTYSERLIV